MDFEQVPALAQDPVWMSRVTTAIVRAATDISAEVHSPEVPYDTYRARASLAAQVLNGPTRYREPFSWAVASQPGITGPEATDSDIQFTVNSLWDAMAGVVEPPPA